MNLHQAVRPSWKLWLLGWVLLTLWLFLNTTQVAKHLGITERGNEIVVLMIQTFVLLFSAGLVYLQLRVLNDATGAEVMMRILELWIRDQEGKLPQLVHLRRFRHTYTRQAYLNTHPKTFRSALSIGNSLQVMSLLAISKPTLHKTIDSVIGEEACKFYNDFHEVFLRLGTSFNSLEKFCKARGRQ